VKVHMKKNKAVLFIMVFLIFLLGLSVPLGYPTTGAEQTERKWEDGKRLFLKANIAISEERFSDAHALAEKLIHEHAGDYQIGLYLHLYAHTFYLVDEDFREGQLRPTPPQMQTRIERMKAKRNKTVRELVKLVMVGNGLGGSFCMEYLREILQRFPESIWTDWAEWVLINEMVYRPQEKYLDKGPEERTSLLIRDLYQSSKKFISQHPKSYMLPCLLEATASWTCWGYKVLDKIKKREVKRICYRVLNEYPTAEYHCARAREILRDLLGSDYSELEGCSKEKDRIITLFYCHSPQTHAYKEYTTEYFRVKDEAKAETPKETNKAGLPADRGLSSAAYFMLIMAAAAGGVVALVVAAMLRKKAGGNRK